jgi:hypothetical protein
MDGSLGRALVIRLGLLSWVQSWPRPLSSIREPFVTSPSGSTPTITIDSPLRLELAQILATIILQQQRQEVLS